MARGPRVAEREQRPALTEEMTVQINYYDIKGKLHENESVVTGFDENGRLRVFRESDSYEFRARQIADLAREARETGAAPERVADFRPITVTIEEERVQHVVSFPVTVSREIPFGTDEKTYMVEYMGERAPRTEAELLRNSENIIRVTLNGREADTGEFVAMVRRHAEERIG